ARSLRSPSQVGGTMTARSTPAARISAARSASWNARARWGRFSASCLGQGRSGVFSPQMWTCESTMVMGMAARCVARVTNEAAILTSPARAATRMARRGCEQRQRAQRELPRVRLRNRDHDVGKRGADAELVDVVVVRPADGEADRRDLLEVDVGLGELLVEHRVRIVRVEFCRQ